LRIDSSNCFGLVPDAVAPWVEGARQQIFRSMEPFYLKMAQEAEVLSHRSVIIKDCHPEFPF
jgi:hypothetical protein